MYQGQGKGLKNEITFSWLNDVFSIIAEYSFVKGNEVKMHHKTQYRRTIGQMPKKLLFTSMQ